MPQHRANAAIEQITALRDKVQSQLAAGVNRTSEEGIKILNTLGAELNTDKDKSLAAVVGRIREKNSSLKEFSLNLDKATYDLRARARWNANMLSAYAKLQAEKAIDKELKPRVAAAKDRVAAATTDASQYAEGLKAQLDGKVTQLKTSAQQLKEKFSRQEQTEEKAAE